jgi:hypothetical protein
MRDIDLDRAAFYAGRVLAVYASLSFEQCLLFGEANRYFAKVPDSRARQLARHSLSRRFRRPLDRDLHSYSHSPISVRCIASSAVLRLTAEDAEER